MTNPSNFNKNRRRGTPGAQQSLGAIYVPRKYQNREEWEICLSQTFRSALNALPENRRPLETEGLFSLIIQIQEWYNEMIVHAEPATHAEVL